MRRAFVVVLACTAVAVGCSGTPDNAASSPSKTPSQPATTSAEPTPSVSTVPGGWGPTEGELIDAATRVAAMSRKEKIGSLLMPQFAGQSATEVSDEQANVNMDSLGVRTPAEAVEKYHLGGVIVMSQSISDAKQVKRLNDGLAAVAKERAANADLPLIIGVDQEGGIVQRVKEGATTYPPARTIGKTGKTSYARLLAKDNGTELRAMGFTLDFAPVADVGFDSPAISSRAYAATPQGAAKMSVAAADGYREAGIVPVVKHFPGHGSATTDSHEELPTITRSREQLDQIDLVPFKAAIADEVPAVLSGHLDVKAVDAGTPSSLSKPVVTGLLRKDLGFRGVTITDSQLMQPIAGPYGPGEAAVRSVLAGEDIILMPASLPRAFDALMEATKTGRISSTKLDRAAIRVTALRLYAKRIGADRPSWSEVPWAKHRAHVRKVVKEAG